MFSVRQKREISTAVQKILRETNHPELPEGEITFSLHVEGVDPLSTWEYIRNISRIPSVNPHNERQDPGSCDIPWVPTISLDITPHPR